MRMRTVRNNLIHINDVLLFAVQITVKPVLSDHARATKSGLLSLNTSGQKDRFHCIKVQFRLTLKSQLQHRTGLGSQLATGTYLHNIVILGVHAHKKTELLYSVLHFTPPKQSMS